MMRVAELISIPSDESEVRFEKKNRILLYLRCRVYVQLKRMRR